jgi:hypothetical protein
MLTSAVVTHPLQAKQSSSVTFTLVFPVAAMLAFLLLLILMPTEPSSSGFFSSSFVVENGNMHF